jgi:hypothetical protein
MFNRALYLWSFCGSDAPKVQTNVCGSEPAGQPDTAYIGGIDKHFALNVTSVDTSLSGADRAAGELPAEHTATSLNKYRHFFQPTWKYRSDVSCSISIGFNERRFKITEKDCEGFNFFATAEVCSWLVQFTCELTPLD